MGHSRKLNELMLIVAIRVHETQKEVKYISKLCIFQRQSLQLTTKLTTKKPILNMLNIFVQLINEFLAP